jgi:hypothetical protein
VESRRITDDLLPSLDPAGRADLLRKVEANMAVIERNLSGKKACIDLYRRCDGKSAIHISEGSIPESSFDDFLSRLQQAQKFFITRDFADASLTRLATPDTAVRRRNGSI